MRYGTEVGVGLLGITGVWWLLLVVLAVARGSSGPLLLALPALFLLYAAYRGVGLVPFARATIVVDDDGLWVFRSSTREDFYRWADITSVRESVVLQLLELRSHHNVPVLVVDWWLRDYRAFRDFVFSHVRPRA